MQKLSSLTHFGRQWRSWVKVKAVYSGSVSPVGTNELAARAKWLSRGFLAATTFLLSLFL